MDEPTFKTHYLFDVHSKPLVQIVMRVGGDAVDMRIGTGYTIVEALEELVKSIHREATIQDDQRMRKLLGIE